MSQVIVKERKIITYESIDALRKLVEDGSLIGVRRTSCAFCADRSPTVSMSLVPAAVLAAFPGERLSTQETLNQIEKEEPRMMAAWN